MIKTETILQMLTEECHLLESTRTNLTNLFDMGYAYESSLDIILELTEDIDKLKLEIAEY